MLANWHDDMQYDFLVSFKAITKYPPYGQGPGFICIQWNSYSFVLLWNISR